VSKLDRIQQLHRLLVSHQRPVPLKKIAERLECSERTAHRLIEDLQLYFNAPVEYSREQNGWHYDPGAGKFELPGLWLTSDELQSLTLLLDVLENFGKGLLSEELGVVEKQIHRLLAARGIEPSAFTRHIKVLPLGGRHVPGRIFQQAGDALLQRKRLTIRYKSYSHQTTKRTISPQTLVHYRDNWYLDAWCHLRDDLRVFSLARIESLEITDESATEIDREVLKRHFADSYGIFAGKRTHTARLRFFPEIAREISMQQWHPEQKGEWDGNDYLLSFPYGNPGELIGDILRHVPNVTVEGPSALRRMVYQRLRGGVELFE
jgi:predicted DNA-binding transcriptional regulator YafY